MRRPDQARFDQFSCHLEGIDGALREFCAGRGLELVKNLNRQPCRVLRSSGNPLGIIGIDLDGYWLKMSYQDDLPHNVGVAAYYQPATGSRLVRRAWVAEHRPFSYIRDNLVSILEESLALLNSWQPPVVPEADPRSTSPGWERTLF